MNDPKFFFAGGTMRPDVPSYLTRQADDDLFEALSRGDYSYVLTARQMGKSSLMVQTARRLREAGIAAKIYDPTGQGQNVTIDQWYIGFLSRIGERLEGVEKEIHTFWASQPLLSPVNRFVRALSEIILPRFDGRLVIFVDEIDFLKSLHFPMDEFFTAVRECHNRRAEEEAMHGLTFCLLGAVTPSELIQNRNTTPFNIGRRIELHDFTEAEAAPLALGLRRDEKRARALLKRVLHWTGGHPYLTQRLCKAIAVDAGIENETDVDRLCQELFLSRRARETEDNLTYVARELLRKGKDSVAELDLYARVHHGHRVADDGTNPAINALRLSGITGTDGDWLRVRNRIYEHVFDAEWIERNLPDAEVRQRRKAYRRGLLRAGLVGAALLLLVGSLAIYAWRKAEESRRASYYAQIRVAQQELENANISRVEELLLALKPETDLRGFEWDYLWQASHQNAETLTLDSPAEQATFSADDQQLIVAETRRADGDGRKRFRISVYDRGQLEQAPTRANSFDLEFEGIRHLVQFSANGRHLVVGSGDGTAKWVDLQTPSRTTLIGERRNAPKALALSPDGKRVAVGDGKGNLCFAEVSANGQATSPRVIATFPEIWWAAFSADGQRVATVENNGKACSVRDFASGRQVEFMEVSDGQVSRVAFSADGNQLVIGREDGKLQLWDTQSRRWVDNWPAHNAAITALAVSPDGKMLAGGGEDRRVSLWDIATRRELAIIKGNGATINSIAWSHAGAKLAVAGDDRTVKVWDVENAIRANGGFGPERIKSYLATAFNADKELLAVGLTKEEGATKLFRLPSGTEVMPLEKAGRHPIFAVFSRDARHLAMGEQGRAVGVWGIEDKRKIATLRAAAGNDLVYAAEFSPDGKRLAFVYDSQTVKVWDVGRSQEVAAFTIKPPYRLAYRVAFSPDGNRLAAACVDGAVAVWDRSDPEQPMLLKGHRNTVRAIAFSLDGAIIVTGGTDLSLRFWNAADGQLRQSPLQAALLQRLVFSPDNKRLLSGSYNGEVKIWDVATGNEMLMLPKHAGEVQSITFSEDGKSLATSSLGGTIKRWRMTER